MPEEEPPEEPSETTNEPPEEPPENNQPEFTCPECGSPLVEDSGKFRCTEEGVFRRPAELQEEPPEGGDRGNGGKEPTERREQKSLYKTETDYNSILSEILDSHPDINDPQASEVMDWAKRKGQLHPTEVAQILSNLKNVNKQTANIVSQKYALALQNRQSGNEASVPQIGGMFSMPRQQSDGNVTPMPGLGSQMLNPNMPNPGLQMPSQSMQTNQASSQPQGQGSQPLTEERLHEVLDEREEKKKEKEKEEWIREMISKQQQLLENLNDRVTTIEKNPPSPAQGGEGGGESFGIEDYLDDLKSLKESMDELSGEEKEKIPSELAGTLEGINSKLDNMGTPEGEIGPHTMEVEKAKQEAEARKIEAEERRKGFKEIADAIRDTADNVGWSIGEAAARSGRQSSNPSQSQSSSQTQMQNQDYFEPKPVRKLEDGTRVMEGCPFVDCDNTDDIPVEPGESRTTCPECNRVLTIPAAE